MIWTLIKLVGVVAFLFLLVALIFAVVAPKDAGRDHGLAVFADDPTPDEVVDELPLRAQQIEVSREGVVAQGRRRVCTPCLDAWADREPSRICVKCGPVFGLRRVA